VLGLVTPNLFRFRGIGIRIEDNLLISHDGVEVINKDCPKDVKEIETLIGTKSNH